MGHDDQPLWRRAATHTLHASLLLKAILEERLQEEAGLLLADNEALINIAHSPMRMSHIAHRLILSRGGTTKVVDRLEDMHYVLRHPDPEDRRATVVEITDSGRDAMARARRIIDAVLEEVWAPHIADDEARTVVAVMDRVLETHDEM
jgi:DNA-binding MarR family transcriptional regulator